MNKNNFITLLVLLLVLAAGSFYVFLSIEDNNVSQQSEVTSQDSVTVEGDSVDQNSTDPQTGASEEDPPVSIIETRSYPSPSGEFSFNVHWILGKDECLYDVSDANGKTYDIKSLLEFETIYCNFQSGTNSSFEKWVGNDEFLISENYRTMYLVDLQNMKITEYATNNPDFIFRDVSESFNYWVFQVGPTGSYVLLDKKMNVLLEVENQYGSSGNGVLYDQANGGFLFVGRTYNDERKASFHVDFLPLDSLSSKPRNLLNTEPIQGIGRGCEPWGWATVHSIPGEIIIVPGCFSLFFDQGYLSADGRLHINLRDQE